MTNYRFYSFRKSIDYIDNIDKLILIPELEDASEYNGNLSPEFQTELQEEDRGLMSISHGVQNSNTNSHFITLSGLTEKTIKENNLKLFSSYCYDESLSKDIKDYSREHGKFHFMNLSRIEERKKRIKIMTRQDAEGISKKQTEYEVFATTFLNEFSHPTYQINLFLMNICEQQILYAIHSEFQIENDELKTIHPELSDLTKNKSYIDTNDIDANKEFILSSHNHFRTNENYMNKSKDLIEVLDNCSKDDIELKFIRQGHLPAHALIMTSHMIIDDKLKHFQIK